MKTVKRKANVGERILITNAVQTRGMYGNGDIRTAKALGILDRGVHVAEHAVGIFHHEYEVIVETPSESARITVLETEVATLKANVEALEKAKVTTTTVYNVNPTVDKDADVRKVVEALSRALGAELPPKPRSLTPNERRADVIKRAKAFVADVKGQPEFGGPKAYLHSKNGGASGQWCNVEFHVNTDKRTVVALLRWRYDNSVVSKAFAKCDPSDVFNADIGKAIALGRAIGVDVTEFERAVQPTEATVGQRIKWSSKKYTQSFALIVDATGIKTANNDIGSKSGQWTAVILEYTEAQY